MSGYEVASLIDMIPPSIRDLGIMVMLLSIVEIAPVKVNPWRWLKSFAELPAKVEKLENEFKDDRAAETVKLNPATAARIFLHL